VKSQHLNKNALINEIFFVKFFMLVRIFFPLTLLVIGLSVQSATPNKVTTEVVNEINKKLDRFATRQLDDRHTIGQDFRMLYQVDNVEFFRLILHSHHQFTLPIAVASILKNDKKLSENIETIVSMITNNVADQPVGGLLWDLFYKTIDWVGQTAFESALEVEDRVRMIKNISVCFFKLGDLEDKIKAVDVATRQRNLRTEKKIMKEWEEMFILPSLKRNLLLQADPRISITKFLSDLVEKFHGEAEYDLTTEENCILKNLAKKVINLGSSEYLQYLVRMDPRKLCLFWFFVYCSTDTKFSQPSMTTDYCRLATIINHSPFKKDLKALINANNSDSLYARKIQKIMKRMMHRPERY
jgi:hypothetical protein